MKHLQKLGYIAIGSVLTLAVMGTALATTGALTIEVNPINVQVNGQTFQPKDAAGKTVPVFAYNGTTYAPLRALAEAYGLKVGYDAATNMATVGDAAPAKTPDATATKEKTPQAIDVQTVTIQNKTNLEDVSRDLAYCFYQNGGELYGSPQAVEKIFSDFDISSSGYDPDTKSMKHYTITNKENGKHFTANFTKSVWHNCAMTNFGGTVFPLNEIANDLGTEISVEYDKINKAVLITKK